MSAPSVHQLRQRGSRDTDLASTASDVEDEPRTSLRQDLDEIHVNMMAFSACIGVGLFLQSGRVINLAGPGLSVFAYLISGTVIWSVMASLGEMTALFPMTGGLFLFPARFLDEGVGYAAGWLAWFSWVVIVASEVLAVSQLWNFEFDEQYLADNHYPGETLRWPIGQRYDSAVWITALLAIILITNLLQVRWFGWIEYCFGSIKLAFIVGLILFNTIVNALKIVDRTTNSRFWAYDDPYSFASQNITLRQHPEGAPQVLGGSSGRFLAMWSAMTTVIFSIIGFETVSVTAGENRDLRMTESIKIATRKISLRVIVLYTLATITVGLNVPYTDPNLADFARNSVRSGRHSVFILAAVINRLKIWPSIFNGFFIFTASSSGINSLYLSSRILHSLAGHERAWLNLKIVHHFRLQLQRTVFGVPYYAVFTSWLFGFLAFLGAQKAPAFELGRLATNSVVSMLITYAMICASFLPFQKTIEEASQGKHPGEIDLGSEAEYDRNLYKTTYPYRSHWQSPGPRAYYGLVGCALFAVFNGWNAFVTPFNTGDFIASYISFAVFLVLAAWFHIKLDRTINPLKWQRHASKQLRQPKPIVVNRSERRGHLVFAEPNKSVFTLRNLGSVLTWLGVWLI